MSDIQQIGSPMRLTDGTLIPLAKGIKAGGFIFLSGQLGLDSTGKLCSDDIAEQTKQTLNNIKALLEEGGVGIDRIIKATVWITDINDFAEFNKVYAEVFSEQPPARSTVVSALALPGAKVEIEVTALAT
ncbi:MAG: RidA family protein [Paraglaciecola sp.]|uniref:RidA family protein n=1 Tax=Paraglaciecola sp. TaxID=1920173 RepID=UPI002591A53A|nr:RidA family protein [uncultured Paraglaciecola sp.]